MKLYSAIDLHSSSNHLAIMNEEMKRVLVKKLANNTQLILDTLAPHRE